MAIKQEEKKCSELLDDIEMIIRKELNKVDFEIGLEINLQLPSINVRFKNNNDGAICKLLNHSLEYIIRQWRKGFDDITVYNYFAPTKEFSFKKRFYLGNIFQRAIIADIFCDINPIIHNQISPYLNYETNYLLEKIRRNGWWNFYDDLEYQPCDADTTAQVMQVIMKMNKLEFLGDKFEYSMDSFLLWQTNKKGGISTWFLPPGKQCNKEQLKQRNFYEKYICLNVDQTTDIEVMANLLFALHNYKPEKYSIYIKNGINYIEQEQKSDGSWKYSWYWGPFYGIYVCVRLLSEIKPNSESIRKVMQYIKNNQNNDGGWGWATNQSDPLSTAYTLIALKHIKRIIPIDDKECVPKALRFLITSAFDHNYLSKSIFINFQKKKHAAFKSNSITMAYIIKAVTVWTF